jgi:hypothetical protein
MRRLHCIAGWESGLFMLDLGTDGEQQNRCNGRRLREGRELAFFAGSVHGAYRSAMWFLHIRYAAVSEGIVG